MSERTPPKSNRTELLQVFRRTRVSYAEVVRGDVHEALAGRVQALEDHDVGPFGVKFNPTLRVSHCETEKKRLC